MAKSSWPSFGSDEDGDERRDAPAAVADDYTWEDFKREYYYENDGQRPRSGGEVVPFDPSEYLGFDPDRTAETVASAYDRAERLRRVVDRRTVDVKTDFDEDEFFTTGDGETTLANRYDLEKTVSAEKKRYLQEVERYWVNEPYAFVVVFHSIKENEKKYYVVEPYLNEIESGLKSYLATKLRRAIKFSDDAILVGGDQSDRAAVIEEETRRLLRRYDLYDGGSGSTGGLLDRIAALLSDDENDVTDGGLEGLENRPESAILEDDSGTLEEAQVERLLYELKRDFVGYDRIDPIKHDINVEDISCDGYNSPVFVYHTDYENLITNVSHGESSLDNFVIKLAQRSGKGISKRQPQVDATLPDGSRAQLTLGEEVSSLGTNYTIRQFKDVPFTPVDLINWHTFSLEEMVTLWLCIENHRSILFSGGTASGKTTSLNAVSLFIPSNTKIVSIEDTREVELPQRNWVASITRPSFSDEGGEVDEFDLLEAALRQRPEFILMGEVRGEEGRTLFQIMSTGHATLTTFHADNVGEVLKRFTTDPINVSKTMFAGLDLVSVQTQTRVGGSKVRRNKTITEINHYDPDNDEINVQDLFEWRAEEDEFLKHGTSNTLEQIMFDNGWDREQLQRKLFERRVVLAYLVENGLNEYSQVAATLQAFVNDPDTILALIARDRLEESLDDFRQMETVHIDVDPEKEALVPRPEPDAETLALAREILDEARDGLLEEYRRVKPAPLLSALPGGDEAESTAMTPGDLRSTNGTPAQGDGFEESGATSARNRTEWTRATGTGDGEDRRRNGSAPGNGEGTTGDRAVAAADEHPRETDPSSPGSAAGPADGGDPSLDADSADGDGPSHDGTPDAGDPDRSATGEEPGSDDGLPSLDLDDVEGLEDDDTGDVQGDGGGLEDDDGDDFGGDDTGDLEDDGDDLDGGGESG